MYVLRYITIWYKKIIDRQDNMVVKSANPESECMEANPCSTLF